MLWLIGYRDGGAWYLDGFVGNGFGPGKVGRFNGYPVVDEGRRRGRRSPSRFPDRINVDTLLFIIHHRRRFFIFFLVVFAVFVFCGRNRSAGSAGRRPMRWPTLHPARWRRRCHDAFIEYDVRLWQTHRSSCFHPLFFPTIRSIN